MEGLTALYSDKLKFYLLSKKKHSKKSQKQMIPKINKDQQNLRIALAYQALSSNPSIARREEKSFLLL